MNKLRFVSYFILVPLAIFLLIGGCGGGGGTPQKLVINANGPLAIDGGQELVLTAAESSAAARNRAGEGMVSRVAAATAAVSVTWAIKSGPGSLTNATSTSVTFCAGTLSGANCMPPTLSSPAQTIITATSTTNSNQSQSVTITVTPSPSVTTNSLTAATEFASYTLNLVAAGGAGTLTWSLGAGSAALPTGLTINGNGTITGAATGPNGTTTNIILKVTDSGNPPVSASSGPLSLAVNLPTAPTLAPASGGLPGGTEGTAYPAQTITVSNGHGPFAFSIINGTLPAGLTQSSSGTMLMITGTPTGPPCNPCTFSVKVTDSSNPPQSATNNYSIVVSLPPPPTITSTSPLNPAATIGVAYNFTFTANGASPFTWGAAPALTNGLTFNANGTITGTPTAPATTLNFNVTVTDKFGQSSAATPFMLVISATPPITINITLQPTSPLAENAMTNVTAHVGNDPANKGVDWSLACGGGACGSITLHTASDIAATFTAPPAVPPAAVTITAKATADSTKTANANPVTITAASACNPGPTTLCGRFTLLAQGSPGTTDTPLMTALTFTADGNGGVTDGRISFNSDSLQFDDMAITPVASTAWAVGADGRGSITLTTSTSINGSGKIRFTFALNAAGTFAFVFESDDANGTGLHQSGYMQAADKTKLNAASITGSYALGFIGGDASATRSRAGMIGAVSTSGTDCGITSNVSNGQSVFMIHNQGTSNQSPITFTCTSGGLSTIDATTGHGNVQLTFTGSVFSSPVMNFAFYVIDASKVIFISTDAVGANFAILSGTMYKQAKSSFSNSDIACGLAPDTNHACVFAVSGESGSGTNVAAGRAVGTASGVLTIQSDDNKAGTVTSSPPTPGWTVTVVSNGLGILNPPAGSSQSGAGLVLIDTDDGLIGIADGAEQVGPIKPQTSLTISATAETFILGTQLVADGKAGNGTGVATLASPSSGNLVGTLDVEVPVSPFEINSAAFTGTYALNATIGRATGTTNFATLATTIIWVIGPNEVVVLDTDPSVTQPVLIDLTKQ